MRGRLAAVVAAALLAAACAARANVVKRLSLDDAAAASPRIEADAAVKAEGAAALRITATWPTTVTLGEVDGPDVEAATLVYSARVKTDLEGAAFLELWAHVGGGRYFSRGLDDVVRQRSDWRTIRTPFVLGKGQRPEKVTLNLVIDGRGTVWVDDVVLTTEPLGPR